MANTLTLRLPQHGRAVVDQQGASGFVVMGLAKGLPETLILLCQTESMGTDGVVEVTANSGVTHLQGEAVGVGIGNEHDLAPTRTELLHELQGGGPDGDPLPDVLLQSGDIHGEV